MWVCLEIEDPPTWLPQLNGEHVEAPWDFGKNTTHQTDPNRSKFKPFLFLRGYYVLSGNQTWHLESPYFYGDLSGNPDLWWIFHGHDYCNY